MAEFSPRSRSSLTGVGLAGIAFSMLLAIAGGAWVWSSRSHRSEPAVVEQPKPMPPMTVQAPSVPLPPQETTKTVGGLGLTVVEFQKRFNAKAKENGLTFSLEKVSLRDDERVAGQKEFSAFLGKRAALVGWFLEKDLSLQHVILMHQIVPKEGVASLLSLSVLANAIRPDEDHWQIFKALGLHDKKPNLQGEGRDFIKDGVSYHLSVNSAMGFVFGIEVANSASNKPDMLPKRATVKPDSE